MRTSKVEDKIIDKIREITNVDLEVNDQVCHTVTQHKRDFRIKKILIYSSSFDFFLLEEEGRLRTLFYDWSKFSDYYNPPTLTHVEHTNDLFERLDKNHYDIIIIFNTPVDSNIKKLSEQIKHKTISPLILLHNDTHKLKKNKHDLLKCFDKCFTWNGDGKIIVSITHYFEDKINIKNLTSNDQYKCILLIEDSVQFYSNFFTILSEEMYHYMKQVITDDLTCEQKELRFQKRPYILHTDGYNEAIELYNRHKKQTNLIISDNNIETKNGKRQIGIDLANIIYKDETKTPLLIQSSEPLNKDKLLDKNVLIISKSSTKLINKIRELFRANIGPYQIIIKNNNKKEPLDIKSIKDFSNKVENLKNSPLEKCVKNNDFSKWLYSIGEINLSLKCKKIESNFYDSKEFKRKLFELIEQYQYNLNQTAISSFSQKTEDPSIKISRIGDGALGGKARGLAFLAKIITKYNIQDLFPNLKITIPRSIVLSTSVFDMFMDYNKLNEVDFSSLSDERISSAFVKSSLPPTILGDLRSFIRNTRKPLIIRSSGLLEDSMMQPFAGIYASMLLPNDSWETDLRFQEVCNAIKHVFSSTYFERARTYIKNTPKQLTDEKMAVLIQEIVGQRHGTFFYPTISGVAKSYNYYPSSSCKPEDGISYLALGLGKKIVDGGTSYAFCPQKPKKPLFGSAKEYMKYAQNKFYALNLKSIYKYVNVDEDTSLDTLDIEVAKKHGVLDKIVSTYIYQDDQIYPGIYEGGPLIVDFGPIINYNMLPLGKAINLLLQISQIILGYPVEIEFAVNIAKDETEPSELVILQIRSMIPPDKKIDINLDEIDKENIIISSENCLGYGISKDIYDIVYVNQQTFDMSKSIEIVNQIRKINERLMDAKTPYILIGPGRWGSSDQWLGIPVQWSNIAGAKTIIEIPYKERHIDPSQGSHFFHDMIASDVMYLITKNDDDIYWEWIKKQKIIEETDLIKHVKTDIPLEIIVDGKKSRGVVIQTK